MLHINDELLIKACPSIQFRIRREIGGESDAQLEELHHAILQDEAVREIMAWQHDDGWLFHNFHGYDSMEAAIRLLREKGVRPQHPVLQRALAALHRFADRTQRGLGEVGAILDEIGLGGTQLIRAYVCVRAGADEDNPCVRQEIDAALAAFGAVLDITDIQDILITWRDMTVFQEGVRWPGIYHLRLLAWTQNWRTAKNLRLLGQAVARLVELSPLPELRARYKSRWVAPAAFPLRTFDPDLDSLTDYEWMHWFHQTELLARLGVIGAVPALQRQVAHLQSMLSDGWFDRTFNNTAFRQWGAYTGLQLEKNWRSSKRRRYDLTFRCLLIQHYGLRT